MFYYLGLDVSKGYADFAILNERMQPLVQSFQLDDTPNGHSHLGEFIHELFEKNPDLILYAGAESTGGYENNWLDCFKKLQRCYQIKVARINPKGIHHHQKAKLNRTITDPISARLIAEYLFSYKDIIQFDQPDETYTLRKQWTLIELLKKQKTQLLNQLNGLIYQANPEVMIYCRHGWPRWLLDLLHNYPTAKELSIADIDQLTKIPHVNASKAKKILLQARQSVASATDTVTQGMIKTIIEEVVHKEALIELHKEKMLSSCSLKDVELLSSITGIGKYSAVGLIIEIGTWMRFPSAKKMASFFGVHPIFKQSGDKTWAVRMSKQGSAEIRSILFMSVLVAIRHNPVIHARYIESLAQNKCKMSAIGVCMHKLLRIVYGVLKSGVPFNPEIDQANRTKRPVRQNPKEKTTRRFQSMDENAPVSARQNKKRKELNQSHDDQIIECGIMAQALS